MNAGKLTLHILLLAGMLLGLAAALPAAVASSAPAAVTGAELMAAVQALRAKQGLPPLIVDAAITYQFDEQGQITDCTFQQGPQKMPLKKVK